MFCSEQWLQPVLYCKMLSPAASRELCFIWIIYVVSTAHNACGDLPKYSARGSRSGHCTDVTPRQGDDADINKHVENVMRMVLKGANTRSRPNIYGTPVTVEVDILLQSFGPVDEVNMDFQIGMFFRQEWTDRRLCFVGHDQPLEMPSAEFHILWNPQLYFPNEKSGTLHDLTVKNQMVKIYPSGKVWYSARMTVKLTCNMNLKHYPLDYQQCFIRISSYAYEKKDVTLKWKENVQSGVRMDHIKLRQFYVDNITAGHCSEHYAADNFSCLQATFHLTRNVGSYVLSTYVPSILIVALSWVSFWISKDAVPARISLGVTTVLTMTTQLGTTKSDTMEVSYPKAIDVWYTTCIAFVFASCLEFAMVNVISRSEKIRFKDDSQRRRNTIIMRTNWRTGSRKKHGGLPGHLARIAAPNEEEMANDVDANHLPLPKTGGRLSNFFKYYFTTSKGVDSGARFFFPFAFIVFNCFYWPYYARKVTFDQGL